MLFQLFYESMKLKQKAAFILIVRIKTTLFFRFSLDTVLISYPHLHLSSFHWFWDHCHNYSVTDSFRKLLELHWSLFRVKRKSFCRALPLFFSYIFRCYLGCIWMDINDLESFLLGIVDRLLGSGSHIVCIIIDSYHMPGLLHHIVIAFLIAFT